MEFGWSVDLGSAVGKAGDPAVPCLLGLERECIKLEAALIDQTSQFFPEMRCRHVFIALRPGKRGMGFEK